MLGKNITLHAFYEAATIKKLIKALDKEKTIETPIKHKKKRTRNVSPLLPLSDFQLLLWLSETFEPKAKKMNIFARKRLQGRLDKAALNFAFKAILKKHEILSGRISKIRPIQILQKKLPFKIIEETIDHLPVQEAEALLENSVNGLIYHYPWQKNKPMLIAKLFHLNNGEHELQLCLPHIISDDLSPEILFTDLSVFYHLYPKQIKLTTVEVDRRYKEYQVNELRYSKERSNRDMIFWQEYLEDAELISFPEEVVVKNMEAAGFAYSSYMLIPEEGLTSFQQLCAVNHVSINDGLCAVLSSALVNCCKNFGNQSKPIFIDIVKSTRDNQMYDDTIGCFLKLAPVKVSLKAKNNLMTLAKQIHQSTIDTAPYQRCSGIIKLASIGAMQQQKSVKSYLLKALIYLYTKLFSTPNINYKILSLCERLTTFQRTNNFVINLNVQKSFIAAEKTPNTPELFGLKTMNIKNYQYDLLEIESIFDVCFLRDSSDQKPLMVISANLKPEFREKIGKEMIRIINATAQQIQRPAMVKKHG